MTPTSSATPTATLTPTPLPTFDPPPTPDGVWGAQLFGQDVVPAVLGHMQSAGVAWARVPVLWSTIEPTDTTPPTYQWSGIDNVLSTLVDDGFTPIGVVYLSPAWAASTSCGPVDLVPIGRYQQFVQALVERYDADGYQDAPRSPKVNNWEISNEEDFNVDYAGGQGDHGGCFGDDPPAYGAHLRAAYKAAGWASGDATIVFGGLAYDRFYNKTGYSPTGPFNVDFVHDTLSWLHAQHGTDPDWPFFDAMAVHIYNDYRNNWDGSPPMNQELIGKIGHFRANQLVKPGSFDLQSVPLMLTEASLPSMPSDTWTDRSELIQAAYPGQLSARAMAVSVANVVWFTIEDSFTGPCDNPWSWLTFGLLRSKTVADAAAKCPVNPLPGYSVASPHEPKPSHTAHAVASEQLRTATHDKQLTEFETGTIRIEAHRFKKPDDSYMIVAFTDNGERLGRKGSPPLERQMTFDASILPDWTGQLVVTDHLGAVSEHSGTSVVLTIKQWPIYVRAD